MMKKLGSPLARLAVYSTLLLVTCGWQSELDDRIVISISSNNPALGVTFNVDIPSTVAHEHRVTQRFSPVLLECGNASNLTVARDGSQLVEVAPFCENGEIRYRISVGFSVTISTKSGIDTGIELLQMEPRDSPKVFRIEDDIVHFVKPIEGDS